MHKPSKETIAGVLSKAGVNEPGQANAVADELMRAFDIDWNYEEARYQGIARAQENS